MNTDTDSPMKTARIAKGWSQRQLAAVVTAAGTPVSDGNLSRIERGEVSPSPKLRRALAEALGIAPTDLP
jgi:transcriptional regulator with XRE-family HTH domain